MDRIPGRLGRKDDRVDGPGNSRTRELPMGPWPQEARPIHLCPVACSHPSPGTGSSRVQNRLLGGIPGQCGRATSNVKGRGQAKGSTGGGFIVGIVFDRERERAGVLFLRARCSASAITAELRREVLVNAGGFAVRPSIVPLTPRTHPPALREVEVGINTATARAFKAMAM